MGWVIPRFGHLSLLQYVYHSCFFFFFFFFVVVVVVVVVFASLSLLDVGEGKFDCPTFFAFYTSN